MNPAPDADLQSVGQANFDWIVDAVADMAVAKALRGPARELRWDSLLAGGKTAEAASGPSRETKLTATLHSRSCNSWRALR